MCVWIRVPYRVIFRLTPDDAQETICGDWKHQAEGQSPFMLASLEAVPSSTKTHNLGPAGFKKTRKRAARLCPRKVRGEGEGRTRASSGGKIGGS